MSKTYHFESLDTVTKDLEHYQFHLKELSQTFSDVRINRRSNGLYTFLSKEVNKVADGVEFKTMGPGYSYTIHHVHPYKKVKTKCHICKEKDSLDYVRVNCYPDRFPILLDYLGSNDHDTFVYSFSYEESLKQHHVSKFVFGECKLYIVDFLQKNSDKANPVKIDETFLNDSVRKLITFS